MIAAVQIPAASAGGGRLPRTPDYWKLWTVGLIFFMSRWIEMIAVGIFIYQRTGSAFLVAFVTMLRILPMGLFGAFLGDLADRVERKTGLLIIAGTMLAVYAALTALAYFDRLEVWHLGVAAFIHGIGWAADNPFRRMMIGEVVGPDRMATAMSIDIGTNNASRLAGPTLGGLLLATVGIVGCFALTIGLYLVALAAVLSIRVRGEPPAQAAGGLLARLSEGFALVRSNQRLQGTLIITVVFNLFGWPFSSMIPVIGQDNLQLGPAAIGMLASMEGLGAFFGAIVIAIYAGPPHYARLYIGGTILYTAAITVFALMPHPLLAGAALLVTGIGGSAFAIMQMTLVYLSVPVAMRGRMMGVLTACIGVGPIGFLHIGFMAELIGAQWATVTSGIEGLIFMLLTRRYWKAMSAA